MLRLLSTRHFVLLASVLVVALASSLSAVPGSDRNAEAHGDVDQSLSGDPGCLASVLRAAASSASPLRQEFVPANDGVQAIELCLTRTAISNLTVTVREGTAAAPGASIGSLSLTSVPSGTNWVHFEAATLIPAQAGTTYVLELTGSPVVFSWRGACIALQGTCTSIDPDLYPAGVSNAASPAGDLGFRTYWAGDSDGDGISDPVDNCDFAPNPSQINSDDNFIDQTPPQAVDDLTWINADPAGDDCDGDDDNDGLNDTQEVMNPACPSATGPTNPLLRDTDDDRFIDAAECALGTDPLNAASFPPNIVPPDADSDGLPDPLDLDDANPDTDGDGVRDGIEFRFYGSSYASPNTDGDTCADGKEIASINPDHAVNSSDQLIMAIEMLRTPPPPKLRNIDLNKDGNLNSLDQLFMALRFGLC